MCRYKFVLLRHWSLYESMYHSPYVASGLGIWNESGKLELDQILAEIGLPLVQAKQPYAHMPQIYKQLLDENIQEAANVHKIPDCAYASFRRVNTKSHSMEKFVSLSSFFIL